MLEVKSLTSKLFGPLSLTLKDGQCVAILGKSGSGKSLFLRAVADLDPNDGQVLLNGTERARMTAYEWRRKVALVPAESGWWADTVGEHFDKTPEIFKALLSSLDLPPEILSWQVSRLSTGERQRLALVRALLLQPKVLMLDEPTATLDAQTTARVEAVIRQQLEKGVSVILITHEVQQAARLADETYLLKDRQLILTSEEAKLL